MADTPATLFGAFNEGGEGAMWPKLGEESDTPRLYYLFFNPIRQTLLQRPTPNPQMDQEEINGTRSLSLLTEETKESAA